MSKFQSTPGKVYHLRLANTGSDGIQGFTIDGHTMIVIAGDLTPIQPYKTDLVVLRVGQHTDILVPGSGAADSSWFMKEPISTTYPQYAGQQPTNPHSSRNLLSSRQHYPSTHLVGPPTQQFQNFSIGFLAETDTPLTKKTTPLFPKNGPPAPPQEQPAYNATGRTSQFTLQRKPQQWPHSTSTTVFPSSPQLQTIHFHFHFHSFLLLLSNLGRKKTLSYYPERSASVWNVCSYNFGLERFRLPLPCLFPMTLTPSPPLLWKTSDSSPTGHNLSGFLLLKGVGR